MFSSSLYSILKLIWSLCDIKRLGGGTKSERGGQRGREREREQKETDKSGYVLKFSKIIELQLLFYINIIIIILILSEEYGDTEGLYNRKNEGADGEVSWKNKSFFTK